MYTRSIFVVVFFSLSALMIGGAVAQAPLYDPEQLPAFRGIVEAYILSPCDEVDGFFLDDGLEVHLAPRLSSELVRAVAPGDRVTVHGLKATGLAMVQALSVTNEASHAQVSDTLAPGWPGPISACREPPPRYLEAKGRVKRLTHDANGNINGVVLDDGTGIRFAQGLTLQDAECLAPGRDIAVSGVGISGALGRVLSTRSPILLAAPTADDRPSVQLRCALVPAQSAEGGRRKLPLINPPAVEAPQRQ